MMTGYLFSLAEELLCIIICFLICHLYFFLSCMLLLYKVQKLKLTYLAIGELDFHETWRKEELHQGEQPQRVSAQSNAQFLRK